MAVLKFLGTSASIPTKDKDNTSFLFKYKNNSFLIDCPGSISHKLLKIKEDYKKIKQVIITHQHPDHIYGIVSLIHTQMHFNNRLTIFSNTPSIKIIKQLIKMFELDKPNFPQINYINVFSKRHLYNKGNLKIKAIRNIHIKNSFGLSFSFVIKKLFYSSDTAFSQNLIESAGKINYLIHDCTASGSYFKKHPQLYKMHSSSHQLANYLKNKPKLILIPVHFLLDNKKEKDNIRKELLSLGKKVLFVKDYQTITL